MPGHAQGRVRSGWLTDANTYSHAGCRRKRYADAGDDADADAERDADAISDRDADSDANGYADANANRQPDTDAHE